MAQTLNKNVCYFGDGEANGDGKMKPLLGGKGANLAEMTHLGLPAPPGFTRSADQITLNGYPVVVLQYRWKCFSSDHSDSLRQEKIEADNATKVIDWVSLRAKNEAQLDYLELLGDLLEEYESPSKEPTTAPLELLNYLVEENDISTRDLGKILNVDHSIAARILKGQRGITPSHAKHLGDRFKLKPEVFIKFNEEDCSGPDSLSGI